MENKPQEHSFRNLLANLGFNIIIPTLILTKLSGEQYLGVQWALVTAIMFPLVYGARDLAQQGKVNLFSALGLINVLLTGGIGLLELDPAYLAIKEASIPGMLGIATLLSLKTSYPLINTLIFNDMLLETTKINQKLEEAGQQEHFQLVLTRANYIVAGSFFLSSFLNYTLARLIVVSQPGTEAFNEELGRMTALSYPVIAIPSMIVMMFAIWYMFHQIHKMTDLALEDMVRQ
jgi:intracellular septation protein A